MLDMIRAEEARQIAASANPEEEHAEADTLAENAMGWATRNAMARTNTRVRMYAKYGRTSLAVKFAPGELDGKGTGNSFYNDLLANSNTQVADAICAIIWPPRFCPASRRPSTWTPTSSSTRTLRSCLTPT